jgi:hypothetical protein
MENFDLFMNYNGNQDEILENSYFDGSEKEKNWTDTLSNVTKQFKQITNFQTDEQIKAKREKELAEKGIKFKILGMNPFVAVAVSLLIVVGGSYAIVKIKS